MTESAAEGVAGAQAVDGFHRDRRRDHAFRAGLGHHAFSAKLHDGDFDAGGQQAVCLLIRRSLTHGDGAFLIVADRDSDVREDLGDLGAGFFFGRPEHGAVIQVQDGELARLQAGPGTGLVCGDVCAAAGLLAQAGDGGPEDSCFADGFQIKLFGFDLQVRRSGEAAVEVQRELVRCGLDRAERHCRGVFRNRRHERIVNVELVKFAVQVLPEGVIAGAGDDTGAAAMAGCRNSHVGGRASEVLTEGRHVLQVHSDVIRVDINADAPDRE
ncbi:hypothetical protein PJL18_02603 [Paenarthrobacter nicotinovorans]|nr:hypothetical protein [Paenarthrobacter nicotinovorans]